MNIYIYIYIERERDRQTDRQRKWQKLDKVIKIVRHIYIYIYIYIYMDEQTNWLKIFFKSESDQMMTGKVGSNLKESKISCLFIPVS